MIAAKIGGRTTRVLLQVGRDVGRFAFSPLFGFSAGWTLVIWLLVFIFNFQTKPGSCCRRDVFQISHLQQYLSVVRHQRANVSEVDLKTAVYYFGKQPADEGANATEANFQTSVHYFHKPAAAEDRTLPERTCNQQTISFIKNPVDSNQKRYRSEVATSGFITHPVDSDRKRYRSGLAPVDYKTHPVDRDQTLSKRT